MMTSTRAADLRGSGKKAFTNKRQAGTTLVEILVVIVIFLIGILAVVQIFPGGFRLLLVSRNNSAATALGRDEIERLKDSPELLPEDVVAVRYVSGAPQSDPTLNPLALGPVGDASLAIDVNGYLTDASDATNKDWMLNAGPNVARRILGEGHRIPSPRQINGSGNLYGGLLMIEHGPRDPKGILVAYANDLTRTVGLPLNATVNGTTTVGTVSKPNGTSVTFSVETVATPAYLAPYEFFVTEAATPNAALLIPTSTHARTYRIRLSGIVNGVRTDYTSIPLTVPAISTAPLVRVRVYDLISAYEGISTLGSVELDTVRLAPQYVTPPSTGWSKDPFEALVLDKDLGVFLFSPYAREAAVTRPGGVSEPLLAKIDYDVLDWRILREDFRVLNNEGKFTLALQSLKVGSNSGADGRVNGGIFAGGNELDPAPTLLGGANYGRDNLMVVDLITGYPVQEYLSDSAGPSGRVLVDTPDDSEGNILVKVDKSRGVVTLKDADLSVSGIQVRLVPPTGGAIMVNAENRTFRVLYRARQEFAVQLVKGASQYSLLSPTASAPAGTPLEGQCAYGISGGLDTRLYFPRADAGRKVTIDSLTYVRVDGTVHTLEGQDFVIGYPRVNTTNLPCIDVLDVDLSAKAFNSSGDPVRGVKGASAAVRVLWNPDQFKLTSDSATNLRLIDQWNRSWRKSTTETYLRTEETR